MPDLVEIAVPVAVRKTFSYSVPAAFRERIRVGMRVLVPFGSKLLTGYVVGAPRKEDVGHIKLKPVQELLEPEPAITESLVETALWVARYYFAPPGEVFRALFPAGTQVSGARKVSLTQRTANLLAGGLRPAELNARENAILDVLVQQQPLTVRELISRSSVRGAEAWIEALIAAGWIRADMHMDQPRVKLKERLGIRLLPGDRESFESLTQAQARLVSALEPFKEPVLLQDFLSFSKSTYSVAKALQKKGLVEIAPAQIQRTPVELAESEARDTIVLTVSQREMVMRITDMIRTREASRCLIHGVTGSGKTEVYLRLIEETLEQGGTAMFLVPEIGLTPLLSRIVVSRFPGQVSLLHSGLSAGERFDQWNRIREGGARVVVGTRSAVFAPLKELRLVVIDEEQDASYKQDESPRYHAREVAWHRIRQSKGVLIMGSATPSIETFHESSQSGSAAFFNLPERIESRPMPKVRVVDMGQEFRKHGKYTIISEALEEELKRCMARGEQGIVLLNRRGYSRTLLCRSCGHVFVCSDCSVSMTYHQETNSIVCHYCGLEKPAPSACSNCGGPYIHYAGVGTEQLESILRTLLPDARIARLDRDTARRRGAIRKTLFSFAERKLDLLVGTQMLAKGHDFPDVTLVGVVSADSGLSFPDFRSAERTFQLLIQVAGRAGRGAAPGRVVLQSFYPDHYALKYSQGQDYEGFYQKEIDYRRLMGYPPFRNLVQILVADKDSARASRTADRIADVLKRQVRTKASGPRPVILGPASAPIEKLRGNYRMQILVKSPPGFDATTLLQDCFAHLSRHKISTANVHVDVDPLSLL
ncbi:MAG: primosomal protein N' [Acidobacteria bacterium]|nr:primosomal protein N' [Acidobacteriota bacterium]